LTPPTLVKVPEPKPPYVASIRTLLCPNMFLPRIFSVLMHLSRLHWHGRMAQSWQILLNTMLFCFRTGTDRYCKLHYIRFGLNCTLSYRLKVNVMSSALTSSLLSYPVSQPEPSTSTTLPRSSPPRELLKNRLYVGNLHPTVDECVPILSLLLMGCESEPEAMSNWFLFLVTGTP
jgi:hypothetical protein